MHISQCHGYHRAPEISKGIAGLQDAFIAHGEAKLQGIFLSFPEGERSLLEQPHFLAGNV